VRLALGPRGTSKRLIYISPGHQVDVAGAVAITRRLLRGRRLPEPIYWADRLSRQAAAKA
jgi:deoxyribonuclease V